MKPKLVIAFLTTALLAANASAFWAPSSAVFAETRCGWFQNPTPANAWLVDREGSWIISTQGVGGLIEGWPNIQPSQWVETNGHYGYGCACMKVNVNKSERRITKIFSSYGRPLSACRKDNALKGKLR
jgi:hypothetical protein